MTYFTKKIEDFIKWTIDNQWPIPSLRLWKMYKMINPEIEELNSEERKWLALYCESLLQKLGLTGSFKYDAVKSSLQNDFGWSEKQKIEQTTDVVTTKIIMDGLLTENTSAGKHDNETFENEAIKNMKS